MPLIACSIGTVTSSSVSEAVSPSVMVWISTFGGANSGKTSTLACRNCPAPTAIIVTAAARTRYRNFRLDRTIQLSMPATLPAQLGPAQPPMPCSTP